MRSYDVRPVIEALATQRERMCSSSGRVRHPVLKPPGSYRRGARIRLSASDPLPLGGRSTAARRRAKAARSWCGPRHPGSRYRLRLSITGFDRRPAAEATAVVPRLGAMFVAAPGWACEYCAVVLRRAYGLGAMAMTAGDLRRQAVAVAWPTGPPWHRPEGALRLGYRKELSAIEDPDARRFRYEELVAEQYRRGQALSTAAAFEIDDVIDPADTRAVLTDVLARVS